MTMYGTMNNLINQKCIPCEGGDKPLTREEFSLYLEQVKDWEIVADMKLRRTFKFKDFNEALNFVNQVGVLAEKEGHHPNINLWGWNKVTITLTTHAIGGLSINDFILAVKINQVISK